MNDEYYSNVFSLLIKMLDTSIVSSNIEKLEIDINEVKERYISLNNKSIDVDNKILEAEYKLMCMLLETNQIEKARNICQEFDNSMENYIVLKIKNDVTNLSDSNNFYAAMLKLDISERKNIDVNSLKFWEGIVNIEKPGKQYRLPVEWQSEEYSMIVKQNNFMRVFSTSRNYFGVLKVFKIHYDPRSERKMDLLDIQRLREYLMKPKVTKNIKIVFEEGIENVYLDLDKVNRFCNFSIVLPSTCKSFGGNLFKDSINISSVDLSKTYIDKIEPNSFINSNLQKIKVPDSLRIIGNRAFENCKNLKKVDLSNSNVEKINRNAFCGSGIRKIKLNKKLQSIELEAFSNCENLNNLDLSKTDIYEVDSGILSNSGVSKIKLPNKLESIEFSGFSGCKNLREVDFSRTKIRKIGAYAFFNSNIEKIKLPKTIEMVEYEAFGNCKNLKSVDFSKTRLRKVASYAFYNSGISNVKLPDDIREISDTSFKECNNLKKLNVNEKIIKN